MKYFDNRVQELKYKVLREVASQTWKGYDAFSVFNEIANEIIKKDEPPQTCCIYKDRAVVAERIRLAIGGNPKNPNVVQVIDIACDECPEAGYVVTDLCRGCIAHSCKDSCKLDAITIDEHQKAKIDKSKCVECGRCAKACKYSAIHNFQRPCELACKVNAISMAEGGEAYIDPEKCIDCGACVYHCPFGATVDTSSIADIIRTIMRSENNTKYKMYAIVAPSLSAQFLWAKWGQVLTGIKRLGFYSVNEVALGADMVADKESEELLEKGFLTSSCCPAFVSYIKSKYPGMSDKISTNLSPMAELGKFIKENEPGAQVVFIGPCIAKKAEIKLDSVREYVDYVMTFEELVALFDSKNITLADLPELELNDASSFGRQFAKKGGVIKAVEQALKEKDIEDFVFNPIQCDGLDKCKAALARADKGLLDANFIEGMACIGGCVGGSGNLVRWEDAPEEVSEHSEDAAVPEILPNIRKAINVL